MHNWMNKLRSRSGETLSEALISVLIVSLASVMLATMISAAASMNFRTKNYDEAMDKAVIGMSGDAVPGRVAVTIDDSETVSFDVEIKAYTEEGNSAVSLSSYEPAVSSSDPLE